MDNSDPPASPRKKVKARHDHMSTVMAENEHIPATSLIGDDPSGDSDDSLNKENECGITEYVGPDLPGFVGILKKRYTDFLVNEILPNGQVTHLDNLKKPTKRKILSEAAIPAIPEHQISLSHILDSTKSPLDEVGTNGPGLDPAGSTAPEAATLKSSPTAGSLNKVDDPVRHKDTFYLQQTATELRWVDKQTSEASQAVAEADAAEEAKAKDDQTFGSGNAEVDRKAATPSESIGAWQAYANASSTFQVLA